MSLLGEYFKQPVEIEVYAIQFAQDMSLTDQIQSAFQMLSRDADEPWDQVVQGTSYAATDADDKMIIVSTASVVLPVSPPDGYHLCVANASQVSAISVGSFSVPARGAIIVLRKNGGWKMEAKTESVLVDGPSDQRVRVWVYNGTPYEVYKVQVTVSTAEGRTMQDEFTVEIEEV
jgi:hypothetical protein